MVYLDDRERDNDGHTQALMVYHTHPHTYGVVTTGHQGDPPPYHSNKNISVDIAIVGTPHDTLGKTMTVPDLEKVEERGASSFVPLQQPIDGCIVNEINNNTCDNSKPIREREERERREREERERESGRESEGESGRESEGRLPRVINTITTNGTVHMLYVTCIMISYTYWMISTN